MDSPFANQSINKILCRNGFNRFEIVSKIYLILFTWLLKMNQKVKSGIKLVLNRASTNPNRPNIAERKGTVHGLLLCPQRVAYSNRLVRLSVSPFVSKSVSPSVRPFFVRSITLKLCKAST